LKKYLPTRDALRKQKALHFFGDVIFENNLWHFNRHSVSVAYFVGFFCCFLPIPFQMIPGIFLCLWLKANVPISIGLIWLSNPITMPPMFYATYKLGTWILNEPNRVSTIELSLSWLSEQLMLVWQPLLLGSLITGITFGTIAFLAVRLYWRWKVSTDWSKRKQRQIALQISQLRGKNGLDH
jgi:uncharacterized protein (DUF2062 family)